MRKFHQPVALALCAAMSMLAPAPRVGGTPSATGAAQPTPDLAARVELDKPAYFVGESVHFNFIVENHGTKPIEIFVGGDYRFGTRPSSYHVDLFDAGGTLLADPSPAEMTMGGIGNNVTIPPGEARSLGAPSLGRYRMVEKAGAYKAVIFYQNGRIRTPSAAVEISFVEPSIQQAGEFLEAKSALTALRTRLAFISTERRTPEDIARRKERTSRCWRDPLVARLRSLLFRDIGPGDAPDPLEAITTLGQIIRAEDRQFLVTRFDRFLAQHWRLDPDAASKPTRLGADPADGERATLHAYMEAVYDYIDLGNPFFEQPTTPAQAFLFDFGLRKNPDHPPANWERTCEALGKSGWIAVREDASRAWTRQRQLKRAGPP